MAAGGNPPAAGVRAAKHYCGIRSPSDPATTSGTPVARGIRIILTGTLTMKPTMDELLRIVAAAGTALIVVVLVIMLFLWFGYRHAADRPHPLNQEKPVPKHHN